MIMGPQGPWPRAGTEVVLPDYEFRVGGQAGNAALALQARRRPMRLLANVGNDILGAGCRNPSVIPRRRWRLAECPTCISIGMTHPNGERTFFTYAGHLDLFGPDDILPLPAAARAGWIGRAAGRRVPEPAFHGGASEDHSRTESRQLPHSARHGLAAAGLDRSVRSSYAAWLGDIDTLLINEVGSDGAGARPMQLDEAVARIR